MVKLRPLWTPGGTRGSSGSFTVDENTIGSGNFGAGAYPSFTMNWYKIGNVVCLSLATGGTYTNTSTSTAFSVITGTLPADIRPTQTNITSLVFTGIDNNVGVPCRVQVSSGGQITFQRGSVSGTDLTFSSTGWTASGPKGLSSSWQLIYFLA